MGMQETQCLQQMQCLLILHAAATVLLMCMQQLQSLLTCIAAAVRVEVMQLAAMAQR